MGWIKEAIELAKTVRHIRKTFNREEVGELCLVPEQDLWEDKLWLSKRDYENKLMQKCIIGTTMAGGDGSICQYCEEHAEGECHKNAHMKKGCTDWWLRFLTKEEDEACEQRAKASFAQDPTQGGEGQDKPADPEQPDEERTDTSGSGEVVP